MLPPEVIVERGSNSALCFVEASRLQGPAGELARADVRGGDDRKIGHLDGVLIDPSERRLKYFVVRSSGWFGSRYLLPTDWPTQVDDDGTTLRVEVGREDLDRCSKFDQSSVKPYSEDDLLAMMFRQQVA